MLPIKSTDTEKMIDVFSSISENENNPVIIYNEMMKLIDYPVNVLEEFLNCMEVLSKKNESFIKENYIGVIGYITLRLNLKLNYK